MTATISQLRRKPMAGSASGRLRKSTTFDRALVVLGFLSLVGLYARLFDVSNYHVTIGGLCAASTLILALRRMTFRIMPLMLALIALIVPVAIYAVSSALRVTILPPSSQFAASYALWVVSVLLLATAFLTRSALPTNAAFAANVVIVSICAFQIIAAGIFHKLIGFELVKPITGVGLGESYVHVSASLAARAIGLVYEPSMCGRIIGTLCFIDLIRTQKVFRNMVLAVLGMLLTKSLGLLVLIVVIGTILFARSLRQFLILSIGLGIVVVVMGTTISQRIETAATAGSASSVDRRTMAPLTTVKYAISNYPLGIPIGANETISRKTGYFALTGESHITNGIYEFIMYFGVFGIAACLMLIFYSGILFIRGERELSAAIMYLFLSTALSGSFLSIESSLLTFLFITTCLAVRRYRKQFELRSRAMVRRPTAKPRRLSCPAVYS
ncbi:hypothetical protein GCM10023219_28920 [Stakelama sediminis]|uniref:O-antigen ligase domain-containing protein n=1 Tax=Stakelama sediminis TaxID=463200 RepID=A0A840Z361_9SPHN|nr:hypothetical protein [Stakelama sediminis]MBB5720355.1 hypothetical protein [Stakelama sediminis]